MHIGEKIKTLRQSKLMTQSELAGNHITRNMLSSIEHGTALPSLPTALYLAERLSVPVGYLLAQDGDELAYRKMTEIANIRSAFAAGDWQGALSIINATFEGSEDDELSLIRARSEYGLAQKALESGRLRPAVAAFDRALQACEKTVYDTAWLRARIAVCFRYLGNISPTLSSDVLDADEVERARALGDELCEYVLALEQDGGASYDFYCERHQGSPYADRLHALALMQAGEYRQALSVLEALLSHEKLTFGVLLYEVFGDLEVCYRKNDDYKRAYEFSGSRLGLLERLLEEL
ncbi:MAG: helix-turn-helix transcriptional regulator [Clostridia bacterium]|nr:helix-turn-helix transcriptional regulator [Clostridia bacterium]